MRYGQLVTRTRYESVEMSEAQLQKQEQEETAAIMSVARLDAGVSPGLAHDGPNLRDPRVRRGGANAEPPVGELEPRHGG